MTNQEAIEAIKSNYPDATFATLREALDIAINQLELPDMHMESLDHFADLQHERKKNEALKKEISELKEDVRRLKMEKFELAMKYGRMAP